MGDLLLVLNIFQTLRDDNNNPTLKFYLPDSEVAGLDPAGGPLTNHVTLLKKNLEGLTDFFSLTPGTQDLEGHWEIWSWRSIRGDVIKIQDDTPMQKKICIFPLLDAAYDIERNWPKAIFQYAIDEFSEEKYDIYEKFICLKDIPNDGPDLKGFKYSTDFVENMNHIQTCEYFRGGSTGSSHLASALDSESRNLAYYYHDGVHGTWNSLFGRPLRAEGKMRFYTLEGELTARNFEGEFVEAHD